MNKEKYLVTGGGGKIGQLLLKRPDFHFLDCDITDLDDIRSQDSWKYREEFGFDVVVNLAAISSVDECELDYEKAIKVNTHGLANLHKAFGAKVLNISSDQVFSGNSIFIPNEGTKPNPINNYGYSKLGAETVSQAFGGRTLRLSRTISLTDNDVDFYLHILRRGESVFVPTFLTRNYVHREFVVDAIVHMVRGWAYMRPIVNYGGLDHITMFGFMKMLAIQLGFDANLVQKNSKYDYNKTPRPRNGGFKIDLAKSLGFPMYSAFDTVSKLVGEFSE